MDLPWPKQSPPIGTVEWQLRACWCSQTIHKEDEKKPLKEFRQVMLGAKLNNSSTYKCKLPGEFIGNSSRDILCQTMHKCGDSDLSWHINHMGGIYLLSNNWTDVGPLDVCVVLAKKCDSNT